MYQINSKKTNLTVKIDDMTVLFTPLGAGTDLSLSQKQRRSEFLTKKIEALQNSAKTDEDFGVVEKAIEELEKIDKEVEAVIRKMFNGVGDDKEKVEKWLKETSIYSLLAYIEEIGKQTKDKDNEVTAN